MAHSILLVVSRNCGRMTSFNLIEWLSIWEDAMWPVTFLFTDADIVFKVRIDSCRRIDISFQLMGLPLSWSWKWLNHFPTYSFPTTNCTLFPLKQACLRNCILYIFRYPKEMLQLCSSTVDVFVFFFTVEITIFLLWKCSWVYSLCRQKPSLASASN